MKEEGEDDEGDGGDSKSPTLRMQVGRDALVPPHKRWTRRDRRCDLFRTARPVVETPSPSFPTADVTVRLLFGVTKRCTRSTDPGSA